MARERIVAACIVVIGVFVATVATVQAAPSLQGESTPVPTLESTEAPATVPPARLGTVTPVVGTPGAPRATPTLQPPPSSGGRVSVEALYVRDQPSFSGNVIGIIPYNQSLYPVGRNGDGSWIAVNWASARGWVYAEMVSWDPALDLNSLPVLVQATGIPPTATGGSIVTSTATSTQPPSPTPGPTNTPAPSATPAPSKPAATTASPATAPAATRPPSTPVPTSASPSAPAPGGGGLPGNLQLPVFGGLGVLLVGGLIYFWQWSAGRAEAKRYARGFVLTICPVCQEGHIHLDEVVRTTMGIQLVRRSARCDTCRSVLRELRPGVWRYSVDALANPEMAARYKTRPVTTAELQDLARHIVLKPSAKMFDEPTAESLNLKWLEIDEPLDDGTSAPAPEPEAEQPPETASGSDASEETEES